MTETAGTEKSVFTSAALCGVPGYGRGYFRRKPLHKIRPHQHFCR